MKHQAPTGVFDITPENEKDLWRSTHIWQHIEDVIRKTAEEFGFQEIRTPIFERAELFSRGIGETSDIVEKEMYLFKDRGERLMSLRPEGTAAVMRAFIENRMESQPHLRKFYYISPMFRYDRPQAGRYRQHHQFGVEAIGNQTAEQEVEVMDLLYTTFHKLGLRNLKVLINSLGDTSCRLDYKNKLIAHLEKHKDSLSNESKKRLEKNPLRVLDSKEKSDQPIIESAPSLIDSLSEECLQHFNEVQALLTKLNIPFEVDPHLVRGLDYYNRTVFEVTSEDLGAQNSIGGGGRYDGLLKELGGPDLPAFGFGSGIERIIQTLIKQNAPLPIPSKPILMFIPLGNEAKERCFSVIHDLRCAGISALMDLSGRKLGKVMNLADQMGVHYVAVVGDEELETDTLTLKEMKSGDKIPIAFNHLKRALKLETKSASFLNLWEDMSAPFADEQEATFFFRKIKELLGNSDTAYESLQKNLESMLEILETPSSKKT